MDERSNLEHLLEMAQAGIKGHDQSRPVSVTSVWDKEAYERAVNRVIDKRIIGELVAKSGILPQNIAELNPSELVGFLVDSESYWNAIKDLVTIFDVSPQDIAKLNPVQLTALVIYTLPERREREGFSNARYLELLGYALDLYRTVPNISEMPIPQRENPLMFFREIFPSMVEDSGYKPASTVLQDFAQQSILDEKFRLSGNELSAIIRNIKNNPDTKDILQDFHTWDGLKTYLFVEGEEANEQIREAVWRSVPRLIEGKGYVRYYLGEFPLVDAELEKNGSIDGLVEKFKGTADGDIYYIAAGRRRGLEDYNHRLERQQRRAERQSKQNQPQVNYPLQRKVAPARIEEETKAPSLETAVADGGIVNADAPNEEYQHLVYLDLSELRSNLHSLLEGDKRSKQAVLTAANKIGNYLNRLPKPVGQDVTSQLGEMVKDARSIKKGESVVWNKITWLHEDYVTTYGSLASRISYSFGRLVGWQH